MKTTTLAIFVIIITMCAGTASAQMQRHNFERSPDFAKLDLRAQQAWRAAVAGGDKNIEFSCMLKIAERLTPDQKNKLGLTGFKPGTIIQTIVTGRVTVENLPKVAALNFVSVIELAVPLNLKKPPVVHKTSRKPKKKKKIKSTSTLVARGIDDDTSGQKARGRFYQLIESHLKRGGAVVRAE